MKGKFLIFYIFLYYTVTQLPFTLSRISQGESVCLSSSILFTLREFKAPRISDCCLFALPCHLVISAGIVLYWLSYLRLSHSSRHLPLPVSDLHAGLHSIYMQRGSLRFPQFLELWPPTGGLDLLAGDNWLLILNWKGWVGLNALFNYFCWIPPIASPHEGNLCLHSAAVTHPGLGFNSCNCKLPNVGLKKNLSSVKYGIE